MQIIDTIVTRESENSAWAHVVFLGEGGESISVRVACPVPTGGAVGRAHIVRRASELLRYMVSCERFATLDEPAWAVRQGRFGAAPEVPGPESRSWSGGSASGGED